MQHHFLWDSAVLNVGLITKISRYTNKAWVSHAIITKVRLEIAERVAKSIIRISERRTKEVKKYKLVFDLWIELDL